MSHLPKLKPSHLYICDRLRQDSASMEHSYLPGVKGYHEIQLKDDGLGKYKIDRNVVSWGNFPRHSQVIQ